MSQDPRNEMREESMLDEQEFQALYDEILKELDSREEELPVRNFANGYGRSTPSPAPRAVPEEVPRETNKVRGNGFLVLLLCLEAVSILAVLALWVLFMMG